MLNHHLKKKLFILVSMIMISCTACSPSGDIGLKFAANHQLMGGLEMANVGKASQAMEKWSEKHHKQKEDDESVDKQKITTLKKDVKGIYLNKESMKKENIGTYIDLIEDTGLNAVVMDVKDDFGKLTYDSDVEVAKEIESDREATVENMKALLHRLKDAGIYTIARIVVFKDPYLAEQKPEWAIDKRDGGIWKDESGVQWIDPYKQEVWKYVTDIAKEVGTLGFDEIQYDYIRFPENAKEIDKIVTYDNDADTSKAENITRFLAYSNNVLKDTSVQTSADVFGLVTSSEDDMGIGQIWEDISEQVDVISPMTYPSHYGPGVYGIDEPNDNPYALIKHAMGDALKRNRKLGDKQAVIRPWVQDFSMKRTYTAADIKDQIRAMNDQGITQFLVWNAKNEYTKDAYK
ncbi:MAG TPA: putative glycoside hydrolase [Bacillota bacterium]|nr:putative glycoside hydrolase [Bacillota bacterium]